MPRSDVPISAAAERESIRTRAAYEVRARREASKRAHVEAVKFFVRITTTLTVKRVVGGALETSFAVGADGELVKLSVSGMACIVRFVKRHPETTSRNSRDAAEKEIRRIEGKAFNICRSIGRGNAALSCSLILADDHDNWILVGASTRALTLFMRKGYEQGIIESVDYLRNYRLPVVGAGTTDNSACERSAYKEMVREMRTPKVARDLQRRASHTRDESELALLVKCANCGRVLAKHDDDACDEPQFVVDPEQVGAADLTTVDNRAKLSQRKNRRDNTRAAATGLNADGTVAEAAKPITDEQKASGAPVYCGYCGAPLSLCKCGRARGRLTREQIAAGLKEGE